jgi:hypothetical protein
MKLYRKYIKGAIGSIGKDKEGIGMYDITMYEINEMVWMVEWGAYGDDLNEDFYDNFEEAEQKYNYILNYRQKVMKGID